MDIEQKILEYGVFSGRRYKEEEKLIFLARITEEFNALGYKTQALKKDMKRFQGINLYIGDIQNAKNLVIAHYDTPTNAFSDKMKFYPFDKARTDRSQQEQPRIYALFAIITGIAIMFFASSFLAIQGLLLKIIYVVTSTVMTTVGYIFLRGFPNPVSANLNTSGVLAMLKIAGEKPKDTAFVLTDRECIDNLGDVMINEALPTKLDSINVIHIRAIGNGENVVVGFKPENYSMAKTFSNGDESVKFFKMEEKNLQDHSLNYYKKAISVSVANEFNETWEVDDVYNEKDLKIDYEKFNLVVDLVLKFLKK